MFYLLHLQPSKLCLHKLWFDFRQRGNEAVMSKSSDQVKNSEDEAALMFGMFTMWNVNNPPKRLTGKASIYA